MRPLYRIVHILSVSCTGGVTRAPPTPFLHFLEKNSELHHIFELPLNWVKFEKKRKIFNFPRSTPSHACDSLNESFISSAVGAQDTLQGLDSPPFLHFLETFLWLHFIFKLPLTLTKFEKKLKYPNFLQVHFLTILMILTDGSYLQWLAHKRHYKDWTLLVILVFVREIIVVMKIIFQ